MVELRQDSSTLGCETSSPLCKIRTKMRGVFSVKTQRNSSSEGKKKKSYLKTHSSAILPLP